MRTLVLIALCALPLAAGAQSTTESEAWPEVEAHVQLPGQFRIIAGSQLKEGLSYDAQQWIFGGAIAYQWQRILGQHVANIDEDKEHHLVLGAGYEYLQTNDPTPQKFENRIILAATLSFRAGPDFFLGDRNRYEYRWVNGKYETRYRNRLEVQYDLTHSARPIRPYVTVEFFYDVPKSAWNEEQYAGGVEWPLGRTMNLQTYYMFQDCSTCNPQHTNVIGVEFNWFGVVH